MFSRRKGCLKLLFWFVVVDAAVLLFIGQTWFNLGSNLVYYAYQNSTAPLEVRTKKGWRNVTDVSLPELNEALAELHAEDGLRWSALAVRRQPATWFQHAVSSVLGAEMNVITITPSRFAFSTSFDLDFPGCTAQERLKKDNLTFSVVANFREPNGKPLGWVYHGGQKMNRTFPNWTGVFFVKEGKPWFGPKSLLDEVPGEIEEGTQGYPSVMKHHTVFSYVDLAPNKFFDGKKITYRSLAGMKRDGTIVFVLSGNGGVCTVTEIAELARRLDVQHATLLDGGRALQYSLRTRYSDYHFTAWNTELDLGPKWMRPQKSPVYIGVKPKVP